MPFLFVVLFKVVLFAIRIMSGPSSFRSKMILDRPYCFVLAQIVLVGSNLFGPCPIQFSGSSYISGLIFYHLDLSKTNWTRPKTIGTHPKRFGRSKIILDP